MASAWELLVQEREREKKQKYQELAADQAMIWQGYQVSVTPVVVGNMGLIVDLQTHMGKTKLMTKKEVRELAKNAQREALCSTVCRHMALPQNK